MDKERYWPYDNRADTTQPRSPSPPPRSGLVQRLADVPPHWAKRVFIELIGGGRHHRLVRPCFAHSSGQRILAKRFRRSPFSRGGRSTARERHRSHWLAFY